MPLGERAAGAGLQIAFEAGRMRFILKLHGHGDRPWPVIPRVAARTVVVPDESIVYVGGASDVVSIRIALASQDVDESCPDASHDKSDGILRANALWLE